jgi:hypothetical protein
MSRLMQCSTTGKDIYWTPAAAAAAIGWMSEKAGYPLFKYQCQSCGKFHLSKQDRSPSVPREQAKA